MILSVIIVNSKNCKKMYLKCHFFKKKILSTEADC